MMEQNLLPNQVTGCSIGKSFVRDFVKLSIINGVLYKKCIFKAHECLQLVLPQTLRESIFKAYHDDLDHQGDDRTVSLIKRLFFWPYMDSDIQDKVRQCVSCVKRKVAPNRAAEYRFSIE